MTDYAEIPLASTDGRRLYCEHIAGEAARELKIPTPAVRFFRHQRAPAAFALQAWTDERVLAGEVRQGEGAVWILAGLRRDELAVVVAHEVHHVWYHRRYGHGYYSPREEAVMEAAAEDFALRFTQRRT